MTTGIRATSDPIQSDRAGVAVELVNLHRSYGNVHALKGLSLQLAPGELVALLGPSGCGKTTALRLLAGLERPDGGQVLVGGEDITDVPTNKRSMGVVFQAYSLFPNLTAHQNVGFGVRLLRLGGTERKRRVDELLDMVGLARHANHYPHQLSGGQQQRIALARALAIQPTVLLLDEPLSALDAKVRTQLRDEIRRIQLETGVTTLFVTHDQEEALVVSDRVGVMSDGHLEQIAPPIELYERPRTQFVAEFVGVTSRLPATANGQTAEVLGNRIPLLDNSATGKVLVLLRPESFDVVPDENGNGRVQANSFMGSSGRVRVMLADNIVATAQVAASDVPKLPPGQTVRVTVRPVPALAIPSG
jgi:putative spermidine/putrescine transport system ATP-binding protein